MGYWKRVRMEHRPSDTRENPERREAICVDGGGEPVALQILLNYKSHHPYQLGVVGVGVLQHPKDHRFLTTMLRLC